MKKQILMAFTLVVTFVLGTNFVSANGNVAVVHDAVDLEYIDAMTMHHRHGIELAKMAESKGQMAELKKFAARIIADRQKDIAELDALRHKLYRREDPADGITVNGKRMPVGEMKKMAAANRKKLEAAKSGDEFDHAFLHILAKHHQMAVDISNEQIATGESYDLKKFSRQTIDKQSIEIKEINEMKGKVAEPNKKV